MRLVDHLAIAWPFELIRQRGLFVELVRREVESRYRGSVLGVFWSFAAPILLLGVFTFVFSTVFEARWGRAVGDRTLFALMLFPGLILYTLFAEVLGRSPGVIVAQPNYVRKIVFPLEMLPAIAVVSAGVHALIGLVIVVIFKLIATGSIPLTALWLPVIVVPYLVMLCGIAWLLSALGVYLRDIGQVTGVVSTAIMFLSPVFYPVEALPSDWQPWTNLSPLTLIIEQARQVLIVGESPDLAALGLYATLAAAFAAVALYLFQRARKGFGDVL